MWTQQGRSIFPAMPVLVPVLMPVQPFVPLLMELPSPLTGPQLPPEGDQPTVSANNEENADADSEELRTLFCGNLDERVTEELLYEVFLQAGPIDVVHIPRDNQGKQLSFGFVTYLHPSAPHYAMQLYQGLELFCKRVAMRFRNSYRVPPNPYTLPLGLEAPFGNHTNSNAIFEWQELTKRIIANTNPFSQDFHNRFMSHHNYNDARNRFRRNSYHGAKPYDRPNR